MRKIAGKTLLVALLTMQAALFMSLSAVQTANAVGLAGFSPNDATITNPGGAVVAVKGLPAWFQGQDGITVKPCLDVAKCVLVGAPDFNAALPLSYPTNFPSEAFYFNATNANIPVGTANALVVMALEFTFVDVNGALVPASAPGAVGNPFQRLRLVHTFAGGGGVLPPAAAGGNFTVRTPWGTTVFPASTAKCVNSGGDTKCTVGRDLPVAGPNPIAALGATIAAPDSAINTFLRDPAAPAGSLGLGAAVTSFIGAPAGHLNSITVTDPLGQTGTTTILSTLTGQTIGMDVQPGVNHDFGAVNMVTPPAVPVKKTITVTNTTGFPVTFVADLNAAAVKTGADAADFLIGPPTAVPALANCAGATLTADAPTAVPPTVAGVCGFDITFTPVAAAKAARAANVLLAPTAVLPANNPPPVTLNLSGTAQVTIATAVATPHGTITPDATVDPVTGGAPAGSPVTFTVTPSNKKFKVKDVAEGAILLTPSPTVPTAFTLTDTGAANHTITATFMQSGDLDADGALGVADAMKALKIVAGLQAADVDDPDNSAVKVAPLDATGQPAALDANPTAKPGIGDVLVIFRRVLGLDTW